MSGVGGIYTWTDALDYLLVGARNVQVTTAVMEYGYRIVEDMISGMQHYMDEKGFNSLDELVGKALPNIVSPSEFLQGLTKSGQALMKKNALAAADAMYPAMTAVIRRLNGMTKREGRSWIRIIVSGCHLCQKVCPVSDCILPGELVWREGCSPENLTLKEIFE